jgi:hypothetical protein
METRREKWFARPDAAKFRCEFDEMGCAVPFILALRPCSPGHYRFFHNLIRFPAKDSEPVL